MLVVEIISVSLSIFFAYVIITQVILPTWHGTRLFPVFRKSRRKLEETLKDAAENKVSAVVNLRIAEEKSEAIDIENEANELMDEKIKSAEEK